MNRQESLDHQRRQGLPTLAVLPIHYPREVLDALDVLGIELWGPPGPLSQGTCDNIQPYVCSLVRNAMAFIDGDGIDGVDGVLVPNTCDSMMGLASMIEDFSAWERPVYHFHLPRQQDTTAAHRFLRGEVQRLFETLAEAFGRPADLGRLTEAIAVRRSIEAAQRELRQYRREITMGEHDLMALLRSDSYLPAQQHLKMLQAALENRGPAREGPGVLVTGIVPEPMALLDALEEAGAVVVAEDYAAVGRRITLLDDAVEGDPLDVVARRLANRPPCSTLSVDTKQRADQLVRLVRGSGAAGVLMHTVRFCEPELFDVPALEDRMKEEGFPLLVLDTEVERELPAAVRTRIEAFVEMLS